MSNENNQKKLFPFVINDTYQACGIIEGFEPIPEDVHPYDAHTMAWRTSDRHRRCLDVARFLWTYSTRSNRTRNMQGTRREVKLLVPPRAVRLSDT